MELNKHHYYLTVIREYEALKERSSSKNIKMKEWEQRLIGQYEYALDHIKQNTNQQETRDYSRLGNQKIVVDLAMLAVTIAAFYLVFYYFEPFKHAESFRDHQ